MDDGRSSRISVCSSRGAQNTTNSNWPFVKRLIGLFRPVPPALSLISQTLIAPVHVTVGYLRFFIPSHPTGLHEHGEKYRQENREEDQVADKKLPSRILISNAPRLRVPRLEV
jgi:hypothetical protein